MVSKRVCGGLRFEIRRNVRGIDSVPSFFEVAKEEVFLSSFLFIRQFVLSFALIRHYPKTIHKESIHMSSNSDRPQLYFLNASKRPYSTMYIAPNLVSIIHSQPNFLIPWYFSSALVLLLLIIIK